jgi:tight adherence protein C
MEKYAIGGWLYKKMKPPQSYHQRIKEDLLQLYGTKEYRARVEEFWSKKYSVHLYLTIGVGLISLKESLLMRIVLMVGGHLCCHYYLHEKLKTQMQEHRQEVLDGFFEFASLFTLMINAGLNYKRALEESVGRHAFSPYLRKALQQIRTGTSEISAFEQIPIQCREPVITRYFACIVQGQRHGNRSMRNDLKRITEENWQEKLKLHKKKGEVLKTKLLFPMILIFIGILSILLLPVMIQFQLMM